MKQVLFVCTGNSCRSVMAEGLFNKIAARGGVDWRAASAGTSALDGFPATAETVRVMKEEGVDISGHTRRRLTAEMVESADRIFVMEHRHRDIILSSCPNAGKKVFLLNAADVPDPIGGEDGYYRDVLGVIRGCVEKIAERMRKG